MMTNITENQITCDKREVNQYLPDQAVFIGYASFEMRSTTVPLSIDKERITKAIILSSKLNCDHEAKKMIQAHFAYLNKDALFVELDRANPVSVARCLTEEVKKLLTITPLSIVIDITTFTHEILLMFLKLISNNADKFRAVHCAYNGAEGYSMNVPLEDVWLSKGCKDVRNVIGYPGLLRPSAKTCLTILTGFELERATKLVECLEPDRLALGYGFEPTSRNHEPQMAHFKEKFEKWKSNYKNSQVSSFQFSSKHVMKTVGALEALISDHPDDNYILVPLNTKLSTVATAITAWRNRKIQVCYAMPQTYNVGNYSIPSQNITIFQPDRTLLYGSQEYTYGVEG